VHFLGRVADENLPALYGCADVFAMLCRNRWLGLEQEGFGIVFLEAAACGVPQVAGDSGGAADAVADGETGLVVRRPDDPAAVAAALARLLDDAGLRARLGAAARARAAAEFDYDVLAARLDAALLEHGG
jgi:phosphatidylinositol alpha-1,6-mannosyltransferase